MQVRDKERKKATYKSVNEMNKEDAEEQRKHWWIAKKLQRMAKKTMPLAVNVPQANQEETDCLPRDEILTIIGEPPKPVTRRHYCFSDDAFQAVQKVFHSL